MSATETSEVRGRATVLYADTSFLISLLVEDDHSAAAEAALSLNPTPLAVSALGRLEFRTAIWQQVGRRSLDPAEALTVLRSFEYRFERGRFVDVAVDPAKVWKLSREVSDRHAAKIMLRSLDAWHLGHALACGATKVATFDDRMRRAAEAEGLEVIP